MIKCLEVAGPISFWAVLLRIGLHRGHFYFETAHSRITLLILSTTHSSITCVVVMDVVVASTCTSVMVLKMNPYHSLPASSFLTMHLLAVVGLPQ